MSSEGKESLDKQLEIFKTLLKSLEETPDSPIYQQCLDWLEQFPRKLTEEERREINYLMRRAFKRPVDVAPERGTELEALIPDEGWLRKYYEATLNSEPPTAFHLMCAMTVLGAAMERNVWFDKGVYKVFPNLAVVLIAPTGRCRKTSATNLALKLARAVDVNVISERITPEALVEALAGRETASGLVYAPELAVFLGRQKYLEGMVPLLTALLDCPDVWSSRTIKRGEVALAGVTLSVLGASTLDWFVGALPKEAFSGGFMSRLLFVVQHETDRTFALPEPIPGHLWEELREMLLELKMLRGEVVLEPLAKKWFVEWYEKHSKQEPPIEELAGYHERKPDHLLRIAILTRISIDAGLTLREEDLTRALGILDWLEQFLPQTFQYTASSAVGEAQQRILRQLAKAGGKLPHSVLMRKNQHYMNARMFREAIITLIESECVREIRTNTEHSYELLTYPGGSDE